MYNGEPHRGELNGLLGTCEMECAVELMLQKSEKNDVPFNELRMRADELSGDTLVGLCQLLFAGYMVPLYPNNSFGIDKTLVERMRTRQRRDKRGRPDGPGFD